MDILCHALYGATLCSRTGLAGGGLGTPSAWRDWTLKAAVGFSLMPEPCLGWFSLPADDPAGP